MKKEIIINNKNDYDKFIKKLIIYKSILYKHVFFSLKNNYKAKNMEECIKCLNIKNRKKRIEFIYDNCCITIDNFNKNKNICGFKNNKCLVQRKKNNNNCNGCCRKCIYQTSSGCSTKNLACKLFNCSIVKSKHKTLEYKDLTLLKMLSLKNRFIVKSDYFSTREDVLKDLYCYTLTHSTIRIIYRLVKNIILKNGDL